MTCKDKNVVEIYTDGACSGNPGPGGWGIVLQWNGTEREIYGGEKHTTNNRMELLAAINALESLKRPMKVTLYTDSNYVKDGITRWITSWKARGWQTAAKKAVKNVDLWQRLNHCSSYHKIDWKWVKGHSGNSGNERADALAQRGLRECQEKSYNSEKFIS